jgi:group I intron endonuclease
MVGIYKIVNKTNNKIYVGQSIDIEERWKQHQWKAFNSNELAYNSAIHSAFRKYGLENFYYEVIEECPPEELNEREIYWIEQLQSVVPNGYNILSGGQGESRQTRQLCCTKCGKEISRYSKSGLCSSCVKLILEIPKEDLHNMLVEYEGNFTQVGKLYGLSDNAIRKKCENYDLPTHSADYKVAPTPKKPYERAVKQIDVKTGKVIQIFCSANEAARSLGKAKGNHITEVCKGKGKTAHGYKWEYVK